MAGWGASAGGDRKWEEEVKEGFASDVMSRTGTPRSEEERPVPAITYDRIGDNLSPRCLVIVPVTVRRKLIFFSFSNIPTWQVTSSCVVENAQLCSTRVHILMTSLSYVA